MNPARAATVVLTLAICAGGLAGCGDAHSTPGSTSSYTPLTEALARKALLTLNDLPGNFTVSNDDTPGAGQVGCLSATDDLTNVSADVSMRSAFVMGLPDGASGVLSQVRSDADPATLQKAVSTFRDAVAGCRRVTGTLTAGTTADLTITTSTDVTDDKASTQVTLDATGSVTSGGKKFAYHVAFDVSLVNGSLALVAAYDLGTTTAPIVADLPRLDTTVVDRLAALG